MEPVQVTCVSGSLRAGSVNTAVLRTARTVAPQGIEVVVFDGLAGVPHFNPDDDRDPPVAATAWRRAVREADALLFSTPEYAGALPGSFKNLLDWLVGDAEPGSIYEKPVAWADASPRRSERALASLRTVLTYANAALVDAACVWVPVTSSAIDPDGTVGDPAVREALGASLRALADAVRSRASSARTPRPGVSDRR